MNQIHKRRIATIIVIASIVSIATAMILYALKQNINVFLTPHEVTASLATNYHFRLGGMVKEGSVSRNNLLVNFTVTDFKKDIPVQYEGILPDLFKEGKGVIAIGHLNKEGIFIANQVLAKHDENYMPKNVYLSLREKKT